MRFFGFLQWLPFGKVPELCADELQALDRTTKVQIVDVRTAEEWRRSRISGAINLPITQFSRANVAALGLDPALPVIAICLSAHRSRPAVRQLKAMGFTQVYQLQQGMLHWWKLGLPSVEDS